MSDLPIYSSLISCLYDERAPVGYLGRGSHYSVMRSVEWLDVMRNPLSLPHIHDFAVVWDEDHDLRVIEAIEKIYMAGLLSPIQFIGERKGMLSVMLAARFYFSSSESVLSSYIKSLEDICGDVGGDCWPVEVGSFDKLPASKHQVIIPTIIADGEYRVLTYLRNIDSLWNLGTKDSSSIIGGSNA